ncbi:DUF1292 domain-containing protein [Clostridium sp. 19966]|uniref:DUF1292 domain-containing protein n=1 Tax=Clostridium sp. 19966 TaxID=2768166 RepID=UPI0028DDC3F4|nr:DUF1292 domain-containing protein [Clostridium sp. 19966]MDT8718124.1 DUF1292 domain-containing protein [Clostridium sp. 19966]
MENEFESIVLKDEDGVENEFDVIAKFDIEDKEYVILAPVDGEDDEAVAFRMEKGENDEYTFSVIEDDAEFEMVNEAYYTLFQDEEE